MATTLVLRVGTEEKEEDDDVTTDARRVEGKGLADAAEVAKNDTVDVAMFCP